MKMLNDRIVITRKIYTSKISARSYEGDQDIELS